MTGAELVLLRPARAVTTGTGWWLTTRADGSPGYTNTDLDGRGEPVTWAELVDMEVFSRPQVVVPPHPSEAGLVRTALRQAGEQAVTTLASALSGAAATVGLDHLRAGHPTSGDSRSVLAFAQWGTRVNSRRVHELAARMIYKQLIDWTCAPYRYVEVAGTVAALFAEVADQHVLDRLEREPELIPDEAEYVSAHAASAWTSVADRELWPDAYEGATVGEEWYRYLMGRSARYSLDWFKLMASPPSLI